MIKADLHTHTNFSDGVLSPEELIEKAKENDINFLSITDHDTVDGVMSVLNHTNKNDLKLIIGCEFSSEFEGNEIHILGYGFDPENKQLRDLLELNKLNRIKRAGIICNNLNNLGFSIKLDEVLENSSGAAVGRPHIANVMVNNGYFDNYQTVFNELIGDEKPAYQQKILTNYADTIKIIRKSGGISSLAHPEKNISLTKIYKLAKEGLDAIEIIHPNLNQYRTKVFNLRANQFGLLKTGGSDYHGIKDYEEFNIGKYFLDEDNFNKFMKKINN